MKGCHSVDKNCFVFDKSNINDAKIDLFYLTVICPEMVVTQKVDLAKSLAVDSSESFDFDSPILKQEDE